LDFNREIGGKNVFFTFASPSTGFGFGLTSSINETVSVFFVTRFSASAGFSAALFSIVGEGERPREPLSAVGRAGFSAVFGFVSFALVADAF
jgi:hypothetical protein